MGGSLETGGLRSRVVGSPGYGPSKDSILKPNSSRDATGIGSAINRLWQHLFGRKKSDWYTQEEAAKDEAARRRSAERESRGY